MSVVPRTEENLNKCQCMNCPTYAFMCKVRKIPMDVGTMFSNVDDLNHKEAMFCAFGKSNCIETEKGCVCVTCGLYEEYELDKEYYCLGGKKPGK